MSSYEGESSLFTPSKGLHRFAERTPLSCALQVLTHSNEARSFVDTHQSTLPAAWVAAFVQQWTNGKAPIRLPLASEEDDTLINTIFEINQIRNRLYYDGRFDPEATTIAPQIDLRGEDSVQSLLNEIQEGLVGQDFVETVQFVNPLPTLLRIYLRDHQSPVDEEIVLNGQKFQLVGLVHAGSGVVEFQHFKTKQWYADYEALPDLMKIAGPRPSKEMRLLYEKIFDDENSELDDWEMVALSPPGGLHGITSIGSQPFLPGLVQLLTHSMNINSMEVTTEWLRELLFEQSQPGTSPLGLESFLKAVPRDASTPLALLGRILDAIPEIASLVGTRLYRKTTCYTCFQSRDDIVIAREIKIQTIAGRPRIELLLAPYVRPSSAGLVNCQVCGGRGVAGEASMRPELADMLWVVLLGDHPLAFAPELDLSILANDPRAKYTLTGFVDIDGSAVYQVGQTWYRALDELLTPMGKFPGDGTAKVLLFEREAFRADTPFQMPLPDRPKTPIPGVFGLTNHGNMCYLNAIVQLLIHAAPVRALLQKVDKKHSIEYGPLMTMELAGLAGGSLESTLPLLRMLAARGGVTMGATEDAHDALSQILDALSEGLGDAAVDALFAIKVMRRRMCLGCGTVVEYSDSVYELILPFHSPTPTSIQDMLRGYLGDETVEDVHCETCELRDGAAYLKGDAGVASEVVTLPELLVLVLNRFDSSGAKISTNVIIEETIDFTEYPDFPDDKYTLIGIVRHIENITHYVAEFKHPETGVWYFADDANVGAHAPTLSGPEPYILLYQRINQSSSA